KAPLPLIVSMPGTSTHRILRGRIRFEDIDGAFGAPSSEFVLDMSSGESIELSVDTLPARVAGWRLYLGDSSEPLFSSTTTPIQAGTSYLITQDLPSINAEEMNKLSQLPDRFVRYSTELWR
ncbi:MAG: hypothetical protein NTW74_02430, partial [Acidobacteria bacterium]|nr:hypothetical protein [Acidobacteriota bacterium]